MTLRVIDTETCGLDGGVVEVASLDLLDGQLTNPMSDLISPDRPISLDAMAIHHITEQMVEGKPRIAVAIGRYQGSPYYVAHNAAFEDSWFKIHLDGYAEARRAGKIIVIDSRQICRSLDADVRSLPRESAPAALENWARRRGTLAADANEQHLGLDDTDLMLRTVQAEFNLKNLFAK